MNETAKRTWELAKQIGARLADRDDPDPCPTTYEPGGDSLDWAVLIARNEMCQTANELHGALLQTARNCLELAARFEQNGLEEARCVNSLGELQSCPIDRLCAVLGAQRQGLDRAIQMRSEAREKK